MQSCVTPPCTYIFTQLCMILLASLIVTLMELSVLRIMHPCITICSVERYVLNYATILLYMYSYNNSEVIARWNKSLCKMYACNDETDVSFYNKHCVVYV